MNLTITIKGDTELTSKFGNYPSTVNEIMALRFQELGDYLVKYVQDEKLSGQNLERRTGKLADSITSSVSDTSRGVKLEVGPKGVEYAAIQDVLLFQVQV